MKSIYKGQSTWHALVGLALMTSILLTGCGRPDVPISAAAQQVQATEQPTPTLSPLDATQQADDARIEAERATALSGPTPATL